MQTIKFWNWKEEKWSWLIDDFDGDVYIKECPNCWLVNDYRKICDACDFSPNKK